ncbi:hypothetical protein Tco_0267755 [Tanacetum coccineum]
MIVCSTIEMQWSGSLHEENFQVYSNPLFEFDDNFKSSNVNPLFEENDKDVEIKFSYGIRALDISIVRLGTVGTYWVKQRSESPQRRHLRLGRRRIELVLLDVGTDKTKITRKPSSNTGIQDTINGERARAGAKVKKSNPSQQKMARSKTSFKASMGNQAKGNATSIRIDDKDDGKERSNDVKICRQDQKGALGNRRPECSALGYES